MCGVTQVVISIRKAVFHHSESDGAFLFIQKAVFIILSADISSDWLGVVWSVGSWKLELVGGRLVAGQWEPDVEVVGRGGGQTGNGPRSEQKQLAVVGDPVTSSECVI